MHIIFRERHGLEDLDRPIDLGQSPADIAILSFSDSDLGAFAQAARNFGEVDWSLRLANLAFLRHPLSVDAYLERTLVRAKAILARLIGGENYWAFGLQRLREFSHKTGTRLIVLPGDGRPDASLREQSNVSDDVYQKLNDLCNAGGSDCAAQALALLAELAGLAAPKIDNPKIAPEFGWAGDSPPSARANATLAVLVFYRSYLCANDFAPIESLAQALKARGFCVSQMFAASLKAPAAADWIAQEFLRLKPDIIVNATAFSARAEKGSPLDVADRPVLQAAFSTARKQDWISSARGFSPADLAMHVALPEVDGRIFAGVVSFKTPQAREKNLDFERLIHEPEPERIAAVADKAAAWVRLARTAPAGKRLAFILSTYPGRDHLAAHAVGLDVLASCEILLRELERQGFDVGAQNQEHVSIETLLKTKISWKLKYYLYALEKIPPNLREQLYQTWGDPENDPMCRDGAFQFRAVKRGAQILALQPERENLSMRSEHYHDVSRIPRHSYVAFYLWLQAEDVHALVQVGAHGTLEWLPGKAAALSSECWPEALVGALPVVYPFIVNDPGEAAQARRRLGAVTLGHMPPPLRSSSLPRDLARLERLLDEYSTADGLDPARRDRLIADVIEEARAKNLHQDLGLSEQTSPLEALVSIDRFVCDIKESQFGDGLHIFGQGECALEEREGFLQAIAGKRVAAGPSGSPWRGRQDVLPTGRNLYSLDPRATPSRAAFLQGVKLAEELVRRHLQDFGDYPRNVVVDLWGSATMRTAGEEFAMALHLAGLAPLWDQGSDRVSGFEVTPLAQLDRPRIGVTLRVSGLFRDIFPFLAQMFEAGVQTLAAREEPMEDNPYRCNSGARVFGPQPGAFGVSLGAATENYEEGPGAAGQAWLSASQWAIDANGEAVLARQHLEERVKEADSFIHLQDLLETDLLLSSDYPAHIGGFAAAAATLGANPALYLLDGVDPAKPHMRKINEELSRIVRARAANPAWAEGMMRHGFRGASELAATLDHLGAFAHLTRNVPSHLLDLYFEATLGRTAVRDFMAHQNPRALDALRARFKQLKAAGLWITRRNSIAAELEEAP